MPNKTTNIRHLCMNITILSCHRCLIFSSVEIINNIYILVKTVTTRYLQVKGNFGITKMVNNLQSDLFLCGEGLGVCSTRSN